MSPERPSRTPQGGGGAVSEPLEACARLLRAGKRFLVTMHEHPDGDAVGSALALAALIREMGFESRVYCPHPVPARFQFLPGASEAVCALDSQERFDATLACDAGDRSRLGPALDGLKGRGVLVNLDHHAHAPAFGDLNLIDAQAASVGVLVFRLLSVLGQPLTLPVANCIWVSLVSDTGGFRYPNTNPECMRVGQALLECGVRPHEIAAAMEETHSLSRLRLLADVLDTLEVSPCGRMAWVCANRALIERAGTGEETAGGFIAFPRSLKGVEVAMALREEGPGCVRVSLRSRGRVDVGAIAARLGGGGHHDASGFAASGTLESVRAAVTAAVLRALDEAPAGRQEAGADEPLPQE